MINTQISEVVKHLIIINVIVYFGAQMIPVIPSLALVPPGYEGFSPYQIVTHMFMHADNRHILFNMLMLFFLGPSVEQRLGPKKFLFLYISAGFGSLLAHLAVSYLGIVRVGSVVGASGAIYGVMIAFAYLFPNRRMQFMFIPVDIKAKYLAMGLIAYDLYSGMMNAHSNTAHFAHLGGGLIGFLIILYWRKNP